MGQHVEASCTGQGSASLGALRVISEVAALLVTLADRADIVGAAGVRRIHHQAWYGVGYASVPGGPFVGLPLIFWHKYMQLEAETHSFNGGDIPVGDTLFWDVQPGGEILLEVDW